VARTADADDEALAEEPLDIEVPDDDALDEIADVELVGVGVGVSVGVGVDVATPPPVPDEPAAAPPADRLAHPPSAATSAAPTATRVMVLMF